MRAIFIFIFFFLLAYTWEEWLLVHLRFNFSSNTLKSTNTTIQNILTNTVVINSSFQSELEKPIYMLWNTSIDINDITHDEYCQFMYDSLLYVANCSWSSDVAHVYPILITATPRSGTVFTVYVLNQIGIKVEDDWHSPKYRSKRKSDGQVSWFDAFYEPNEFLHPGPSRLHNSRFKHVLHQIREPLKAIASMCTIPLAKKGRKAAKFFKWINNHINNALEDIFVGQHRSKRAKAVEYVMEFYYRWHSKLNMFGFPIFKIENLYSSNNQTAIDTLNWIIDTAQLRNKVNINDTLSMNDDLYKVFHTRKNSRMHRPTFTWDELFLLNESIAMNLWKLSQQYGYSYNWSYDVFNTVTRYTHKYKDNPRKYIRC